MKTSLVALLAVTAFAMFSIGTSPAATKNWAQPGWVCGPWCERFCRNQWLSERIGPYNTPDISACKANRERLHRLGLIPPTQSNAPLPAKPVSAKGGGAQKTVTAPPRPY